MCPDRFFVGVNLPWLQYGCDFGANAWQPDGGVASAGRRARMEEAFARLADRGLDRVRWFMLCDGRAGVQFGPDGAVTGLDDRFWRDLDAGVGAASRHGVSLVFVLFDFTWWKRGRTIEGVRCGGHSRATTTAARREALLDRVVTPILRRCGRDPAVAAWDVVNEPEWATLGRGTANPLAGVWPGTMRELIRGAVERAHGCSSAPVTVGLASWRGLGLVRGLGLDAYQAHWYDRRNARAPLETPVAATLDRPIWLGEFPTASSGRSSAEILETARRAGYAGAFGWSAEAGDEWSDANGLKTEEWRRENGERRTEEDEE